MLANAETVMINEMPIIPLDFEYMGHLVYSPIEDWYPIILDFC
jgi:hypothetical protein